jgi:c-di-GMP-binding flagellar brake protein YcgR
MSSVPGKAMKQAADRLRRQYGRYRCEFPVLVSMLSGEAHQQWNAHCRDVSETGIGVLVGADLILGEVASLKFSLPEISQSWDVRAILRHRRGYHYGFEFVSLSDRQSRMLKDYLQTLERTDSDE